MNNQVLALSNQAPFLPKSWFPTTSELMFIADTLAGDCVEFENETEMSVFLTDLLETLTGQRQN